MSPTLRILWFYLLTKYRQSFPNRASLLVWQDKQVRIFLHDILPKSKFYRQYYQGLDIHKWQELPIIDKSIMMANFDQLNTVGISKEDALQIALTAEKQRNFSSTLNGFTIGLSSGTSGNRGLFLVSQAEQQAWAGTILAKALPGSILTPQRIAFFLRANSNLYETVKRQRIQFQYFDLFNSVSQNIVTLNQYQPTILVAPPSMLRMIADAQREKKINITPIKIISVAEVLDPLDEIYISHCFQQKVHQLYQCTEGFLAHTCEYGTLHLNEDILVIQKEYIDRDAGKFMPIITDFNRTTQPIIRYRLDDILTERQAPCPCGSVLTAIDCIEGRRDDIFYLPSLSGDKLIPIFPDFIRRAIMIASGEIKEYLVIQRSHENIEVYLLGCRDNLPELQLLINHSFGDLFAKLNCQIPEITYFPYPERTEHHQKLRRVRRIYES